MSPAGRAAALALLLSVISILGFSTPSASAATYDVKLCAEGSGGDGIELISIPQTVGLENLERCTDEVGPLFIEGIAQNVSAMSGTNVFGGVQWNLHAPEGTTITTLKARLGSSFFWDPELFWFASNGTRRLDKVEAGGTAQRLENVEYSVQSKLFSAALQCLVHLFPGCPLPDQFAHSGVTLKNMTATLEDEAPPTVALGTLPPRAFGTVDIPITASDSGAGIEKVEVLVDGKPKETISDSNQGRCARPFIFLVPCALRLSFSLPFDTTKLKAPDGLHTFTVAATDAAGQVGAASATIDVHNGPLNKERPRLSGSAVVDSTLSGTPGNWEGFPASFSFQWLRCEATVQPGQDTGCSPIPGATESTYVPEADDVGTREIVKVIASNPFGTMTAISDPSQPVVAAPEGPDGEGPGVGGRKRPPRLSKVSLKRRRFRVGGRAGGRLRVSGRARGTVLRFSCTQPGRLRILVARKSKTGSAKPVGSLTRSISSGHGHLAFSGRFGHRALRPGRYQMTVIALDRSGIASQPVRLGFAILTG